MPVSAVALLGATPPLYVPAFTVAATLDDPAYVSVTALTLSPPIKPLLTNPVLPKLAIAVPYVDD